MRSTFALILTDGTSLCQLRSDFLVKDIPDLDPDEDLLPKDDLVPLELLLFEDLLIVLEPPLVVLIFIFLLPFDLIVFPPDTLPAPLVLKFVVEIPLIELFEFRPTDPLLYATFLP